MSGPSPAGLDATYSTVDVVMPIAMDVSGLIANLFGEAPATLAYPEIVVATAIPVTGLFKDVSGAAWIHYIQDTSENTFEVAINQERATALHADLSGALNVLSGSTYNKDSQDAATALVPSITGGNKAAPFDGAFGAAWEKYSSVQDMVISYFAIKILGHPGALAAISNDSVLRAGATAGVAQGLEQLYGQAAIAVKQADGLTDKASKDTVNTGYVHLVLDGAPGEEKYLSGAQVLSIVEQVMNVDPARFATQDKDMWQPMRWISGDKLRFHLRLSNNSFTVKASGTNSLVPGGAAQSIAETRDYQLVFTVA
jgi:hypothetical protein